MRGSVKIGIAAVCAIGLGLLAGVLVRSSNSDVVTFRVVDFRTRALMTNVTMVVAKKRSFGWALDSEWDIRSQALSDGPVDVRFPARPDKYLRVTFSAPGHENAVFGKGERGLIQYERRGKESQPFRTNSITVALEPEVESRKSAP